MPPTDPNPRNPAPPFEARTSLPQRLVPSSLLRSAFTFINLEASGEAAFELFPFRPHLHDRCSIPKPMAPQLEDAWRQLADGVHMHRYFLHVCPMREQYMQQLLDRAVRSPRDDTQKSSAPSWLTGYLEHAVAGTELNASDRYEPVPPSSGPTVTLLERPIIVGNSTDCVDSRGERVLTRDFLHRKEPRMSPEFADRVSGFLSASQLSYLVTIPVGVIVQIQGSPGTPINRKLPKHLATIYVPSAHDPLSHGEGIAAGAADLWFRSFWLASPDAADRAEVSPTTLLRARRILSAAVRFRYLSKLIQNSMTMPERTVCLQRLQLVNKQLRSYESKAYQIIESLDDLNLYDFINSFFPGTRQFEKYGEGLGIGQS